MIPCVPFVRCVDKMPQAEMHIGRRYHRISRRRKAMGSWLHASGLRILSHLRNSMATQVHSCTVKSVSNMDTFFILNPSCVSLGMLPNSLMSSLPSQSTPLPSGLKWTILGEYSLAALSRGSCVLCLFFFQSTVSSGPGSGVGVLFVPTARFQSVLLESSFPFEITSFPLSAIVIH